jgi:hypothetical protein
MTNRLQVIVTAAISASAGFINWLCTLPPEQQSGLAATLVEIVPLHWRPTVGVWTRGAMFVLGIVATYKASQTQPLNPKP